MGTIVAIEANSGVAIAGDKRVTHGGTITSESANRIFDLDEIGAGVVGEEGDVDEFGRQLEAKLKEEEHEREINIDVLGRIASGLAEDAGVQAIVGTTDDEGVAKIRQIDSDGAVLSESIAALGSGAQIALGRLEAADRDQDLRSTEELVRDIVESVSKRDSDTGEEVDLWSLASKSTAD